MLVVALVVHELALTSWDQPGLAVQLEAVTAELGCPPTTTLWEVSTSFHPQLFAASPFSKKASFVCRLTCSQPVLICSYGSWNDVTQRHPFSLFFSAWEAVNMAKGWSNLTTR